MPDVESVMFAPLTEDPVPPIVPGVASCPIYPAVRVKGSGDVMPADVTVNPGDAGFWPEPLDPPGPTETANVPDGCVPVPRPGMTV